jgi:hypothetical protein
VEFLEDVGESVGTADLVVVYGARDWVVSSVVGVMLIPIVELVCVRVPGVASSPPPLQYPVSGIFERSSEVNVT